MTKCTARCLLTLMMILSCVSVSIGQLSRDTEKISIQSKNKPLRYVLEEISKKTNVEFIFDDRLVDGKTVICDLNNITVEEALEQILREAGIAHREVYNRRIVLFSPPQQNLRCKISGRVIDSETGEPLYYANVYMANTTKGCVTDRDGNFVFEEIPPSIYHLVVHYIGYESRVIEVRLIENELSHLDVKMKPIILKGESVEVAANYPTEWRKHLKRFERVFLGTTKNSKKTKIINPEVLNFKLKPNTGEFIATTDSILHVENRALGYRLCILLKTFVSSKRVESVYFHPRFELLEPKNTKEQKKWIKNREKTYRGSFKHFLWALTHNKIDTEKFSIDMDSCYVYPDTGWVRLFFLNGLVRVIYDKNHINFIKMEEMYAFKNDYVLIDQTGNVLTPHAIMRDGEWAKEGIADLLPLEFDRER